MRVSIAIEVEDGDPQPVPALSARYSRDHTGLLAPFITQVAATYLRAPVAWAQEGSARAKAIAGY